MRGVQPPPVRFTSCGGSHLAYQVVGDSGQWGMALTSWSVPVDGQWESPEHLRIWRTVLAAGVQTIHLDHRGVGSSDPVPPERIGDLDEWADDVIAVLDAEGIDRIRIMAEAEQVAVALRLASRFPDRVDRLAFPHVGLRLPWPAEELATLAESSWGTGEMLERFGLPGDRAYLARTERMAAARGTAAALFRAMSRWDVAADIPRVTVPCMVMSVVGAPVPEQARDLAEALPHAELVEVVPTGLYWGDRMFERILDFMGFDAATGERRLTTLVLTDVVGSTDRLALDGDREWRRTLDVLDDLVADRTTRRGGQMLKHTGDGHLLSFEQPGQAVDAAIEITEGSERLGVHLRSAVHTGEIEVRDNDEVAGMTVHVVARLAALAGPREVLASRTVADLAASAGREFADRGEHELKGVPGRWQVFDVS